MYEVMNEAGGGDLKIDGVNHLLEYPEYSEPKQLKEMLDLFEDKENILKLVSSTDAGKDLQVIYSADFVYHILTFSIHLHHPMEH